MRNFAEILKEEREKMSLSQTDLGEKLNCSRYRVADLERGRITPTIEDIKFLCDLFGISSDYLLGRTEIRTTDLTMREMCDFTGFSERLLQLFHSHKEITENFHMGNVVADFMNQFEQSGILAHLLELIPDCKATEGEYQEIAEYDVLHANDLRLRYIAGVMMLERYFSDFLRLYFSDFDKNIKKDLDEWLYVSARKGNKAGLDEGLYAVRKTGDGDKVQVITKPGGNNG